MFLQKVCLNDQALLRYSRHILLHELDVSGQEKLLSSNALVIGAGGLGSPVSLYLASAGVGHITIVDADSVELSNLQRQIAHDMGSLGQNKAVSAMHRMKAINPEVNITVLQKHLSNEDLQRYIPKFDVIVDCSDNAETRYAVNEVCVTTHIPLVSGSAIRFSGQLAVYDLRDKASPCYACVFPKPEENSDCSCASLGVLSPVVGVMGSLQAVEVIKLLSGLLPYSKNKLTLYDALTGDFQQIYISRSPNCPVCASI